MTPASRTEWLGGVFVQAGLGIPLGRGAVVVEPYVRHERVLCDDRLRLSYASTSPFACSDPWAPPIA